MPKGFHDLVARIHFLNMAVEFTKRPLLLAEVRLRAFRNTHCDQQAQRERQHDDQAQNRLIVSMITITPISVTTT